MNLNKPSTLQVYIDLLPTQNSRSRGCEGAGCLQRARSISRPCGELHQYISQSLLLKRDREKDCRS